MLMQLTIIAVLAMGGVEDDGRLNLMFDGHDTTGRAVALSANYPSEAASPRINGDVLRFGKTYRVSFEGECQKIGTGGLLCTASTMTITLP